MRAPFLLFLTMYNLHRQHPKFVKRSPNAGFIYAEITAADQFSQADAARHLAVPAPLEYGSCSIGARRSVPAHLLSDVARWVYLPEKVVLLLPPSAREGASPGRTYRTCAHGVPQLTPTPPNPCTVKAAVHSNAAVHDTAPTTPPNPCTTEPRCTTPSRTHQKWSMSTCAHTGLTALMDILLQMV